MKDNFNFTETLEHNKISRTDRYKVYWQIQSILEKEKKTF